MSLQLNLNLTIRSTSLQGSEFGLMPSYKQAGQMTDQSLPDLVHASPGQAQEKGLITKTTEIYGGQCFGTSNSFALQQSLVSKLHQAMDCDGGILWRLTWKQRTTPQLRLIYQLRALGYRISDKDCFGWQTPTVQDGNARTHHNQKDGSQRLSLLGQARTSHWPTPKVQNASGSGPSRTGNRIDLQTTAGWATPLVPNGGRTQSIETTITGKRPNGVKAQIALNNQAQLCSGSTAGTKSIGQLNPALARWLMGLPPIWCKAAILAHRQRRQRRQGRCE